MLENTNYLWLIIASQPKPPPPKRSVTLRSALIVWSGPLVYEIMQNICSNKLQAWWWQIWLHAGLAQKWIFKFFSQNTRVAMAAQAAPVLTHMPLNLVSFPVEFCDLNTRCTPIPDVLLHVLVVSKSLLLVSSMCCIAHKYSRLLAACVPQGLEKLLSQNITLIMNRTAFTCVIACFGMANFWHTFIVNNFNNVLAILNKTLLSEQWRI